MKFLRYFLMICFCLFIGIYANAQVDPEDPPDDGSGTELGVPISGTDFFYLAALVLGGFIVYGQHKKSRISRAE
jgi:hypothetical protein